MTWSIVHFSDSLLLAEHFLILIKQLLRNMFTSDYRHHSNNIISSISVSSISARRRKPSGLRLIYLLLQRSSVCPNIISLSLKVSRSASQFASLLRHQVVFKQSKVNDRTTKKERGTEVFVENYQNEGNMTKTQRCNKRSHIPEVNILHKEMIRSGYLIDRPTRCQWCEFTTIVIIRSRAFNGNRRKVIVLLRIYVPYVTPILNIHIYSPRVSD